MSGQKLILQSSTEENSHSISKAGALALAFFNQKSRNMKYLYDRIGEYNTEKYFEDDVTNEEVLHYLEACVQENDSWLELNEAHVCIVSFEDGVFHISGDEDCVELELKTAA